MAKKVGSGKVAHFHIGKQAQGAVKDGELSVCITQPGPGDKLSSGAYNVQGTVNVSGAQVCVSLSAPNVFPSTQNVTANTPSATAPGYYTWQASFNLAANTSYFLMVQAMASGSMTGASLSFSTGARAAAGQGAGKGRERPRHTK
ncbi:MAG TPA: hypothetical protein VJ739_18690 [Gemmataceae bacterium]|nr:hypothetical protein [Gemmataceae bacterium]